MTDSSKATWTTASDRCACLTDPNGFLHWVSVKLETASHGKKQHTPRHLLLRCHPRMEKAL